MGVHIVKAYKINPKNGAVNMDLGLLTAERGNLVKAEKHLRTALEEPNTMPQSAYNLAVIVGAKDPEEAVRLCRRALAAVPGNQRYQQTLQYYMRESARMKDNASDN